MTLHSNQEGQNMAGKISAINPTANTKGLSRLEKLPNEMLAGVALHLDAGSLGALRATSKRLRPVAHEAMEKQASFRVRSSAQLPQVIKAFPKIQHLNASEVAIGDETIKDNIKNIPLKSLNLEYSIVSDKSALNIAKIETLEKLTLRENSITSKGISAISKMKNLKEVDLSYTEMDDDGAVSLARNNKLEIIKANNTQITNEGELALATTNNKNLKKLDLRSENLEDHDPTSSLRKTFSTEVKSALKNAPFKSFI